MTRRTWAPLILLGLLGMFLSEVGVWNLQPLIAAFARAPLLTPHKVLMAHAVYLSLFLLAAHLIQRWRVDDVVSLLLMGSVYGLINEGLFADKILVGRAPGPRVLGVPLLDLAFTGLSAHPAVDFLGAFLLYRAALTGRLGLEPGGPGGRGLRQWFGICLLWGALAFGSWHLRVFRGGIPLGWQAFSAAYVFVLLFVFGRLSAASGAQALPDPLLGRKGLLLCLAPILLSAVLWFLRLAGQGRLGSFVFFLAVLAGYSLLTVVWVRSRPRVPEKSILDQCFPVRQAPPSLSACLKLAAVAGAAFLVVRFAAVLPALRLLLALVGVCLVFAGIVFAAAFPCCVLWRLLGRRAALQAQQAHDLGETVGGDE